ncbi:MAG TPA: TonB-dependent receptor plug domain-containing protein, partial [Opitutaceae bacterium]
ERGYQATETLAGTRIKTDLKDVGASIDILTGAFLQDVGAFDMWDGAQYVANVEIFSGSASDAGNNAQWFDAGYNSRGVYGNTVMVDFFPTGAVPIDRYNTDNLTFLRGPNAILFGIGSPSGVIGASTKRAQLRQNSVSVGYMTDDNHSQRGTLDVNQVLLENTLALRVAAVMQDRHTFKEGSLNRRNAVFGTLTYRPFTRTTVTLSAEKGIWDRVHDQNNIVVDRYTPWVQAGRPTVNWQTGAGQTSPGKGNYSTAFGSGLAKNATARKLIYIEGSGQTPLDWNGMASGALITDPTVPAVDRNNLNSTAFNETTNTLTLPDGTQWELDLAAYTFGGLRRNDMDYDSKSIFIEQNILRDLDLELAWNQYTTDYVFDNFGTFLAIEVDPNQLLPDGTPNPNVGRPYIETGNSEVNREKRVYETRRATLAYKLDLDQYKVFRNVGFGNYRVSALYEESLKDTWHQFSRYANTNGPNANLNDGTNLLQRRYYLQHGESSYRYGGPRELDFGNVVVREVAAHNAPRRAYQNIDSLVFAVQGQWWQSRAGYYRLVGLYGERHDTKRENAMAFTRNPANGTYNIALGDYDSNERAGRWNNESKISPKTKTYSVTGRPISFLSVFYNYSDIFRAGEPSGTDINDQVLRPTYGDTDDYGVKLDLWKSRVFMTATKYETTVFDATVDGFGNGSIRGWINDIYTAIGQTDKRIEAPRVYGYRDDGTEGYELAITANITRNWRTRVSAGKQKTTISRLFDELQAYVDTNAPLWQQYAAVELTDPARNDKTNLTVGEAIADIVQATKDQRAPLGSRPTYQREYNATFTTNYTVPSGMLKDVRIGGGFRWASSNIIGYARDSRGIIDVTRPFKGPEEFSTDMTLGYSRKLTADILWDIQLNIYNVLDDDDPIAKQAIDNGRGQPIVFRRYLPAPRTFQLSTSLRF